LRPHTIAGGKHRGLNRATWGMRLKPPLIPPAATVLFEASQGPRVLPGTYTVKLIKGDQTYSGTLKVVLDPRAKYSLDDRKAQFDLSMKLYRSLEHMSYATAAIQGVRDDATARTAKLGDQDPLRARLQKLAADSDALRSKIVATKEGGMITGEERLRENLTDLYGNVIYFDGRPSRTEFARTTAIGREMTDVSKTFEAWISRELGGINSALAAKQLQPIPVLVP